MKAKDFSLGSQTRATTRTNRPSGWRRVFSGVRFRILVWYFLITSCTITVSILVTRQIFCNLLEEQVQTFLLQEVTRFQKSLSELNPQLSKKSDVTVIFKQVWSSYIPTTNKFLFALVDGQRYLPSHYPLPDFIEQNPNQIDKFAQLDRRQQNTILTPNGPIYQLAEPIRIDGKTHGVLVAVYDATDRYQVGTKTIILVIKVTVFTLAVFSLLAWITAGRVLSPLRLLTQTARSITESDMTQRIPVQGTDEIADLTATFNEMLDRLQFAFDGQLEFLKDASHELRTPITVIQGQIEMLKYRPDRQDETIELVIDELSRMTRLVNDLLLLARSERPDFLEPKLEDLDSLTEELYLKTKTLANRNWQLESKGLSFVMVDRQRLTQAIMNLVQNAVWHTQEGDTIALGSTSTSGYIHFWVRDTGKGIALEDRERIFKRFIRASDNDSCCEGAGLGLSIVEAIASAHGGRVELSSRLNYGSTFTIVIPLISTQEIVAHESNSDCRGQPPYYRFFGDRATGSRVHDRDY